VDLQTKHIIQVAIARCPIIIVTTKKNNVLCLITDSSGVAEAETKSQVDVALGTTIMTAMFEEDLIMTRCVATTMGVATLTILVVITQDVATLLL
jgi:hypothetical protein